MSQKSRTAQATLHLSRAHSPGDSTEESRLAPDEFPAVLAISRITALMEAAAIRLVQQGLHAAEVSVGVTMNVTHVAAALKSGHIRGTSVRAVAIYRSVAGRLHHVAIDAFDESGLIASAEHTRAIVIGRRVEALARRRAGKRSMPLTV